MVPILPLPHPFVKEWNAEFSVSGIIYLLLVSVFDWTPSFMMLVNSYRVYYFSSGNQIKNVGVVAVNKLVW